MAKDLTFNFRDGDAADTDASIASIRDAINGPAMSQAEREALLAEAEAMGKELTKAAFESSVV
ncbi:hypothetical protein [Limimaricola sp.]|uniref:hypothetical protein n=1 Tax=Limimaricola sp. TaxID=2211665 RepID=UPI0040598F70